MNGETFAVVTADGREHPAVDLQTIQKWYFESNLSDDSLVFSTNAGDWRPLGRTFDTRAWNTQSGRVDHTAPDELLYQTSANDTYYDELTSLAVPPDADFTTVQHYTSFKNTTISKSAKHGTPGLTAVITLLVFGVFGIFAYFVLTSFVFYDDTVSFSNNKGLTSLKTQVLGTPFSDPSGVHVNMPGGWSLVSPKMPEAVVQAPDAKMFAVNFEKKMFAALEIVPMDAMDLKAKMSQVLQKYRSNANGPFSVIADYDIQIGSTPARKSIYSRRDKAVDAGTTTHMLIAKDKDNLYIYQIWTPTTNYSAVSSEFDAAEKALTLP